MKFLGCLKISWTDPPVSVCAECPPWDPVHINKKGLVAVLQNLSTNLMKSNFVYAVNKAYFYSRIDSLVPLVKLEKFGNLRLQDATKGLSNPGNENRI